MLRLFLTNSNWQDLFIHTRKYSLGYGIQVKDYYWNYLLNIVCSSIFLLSTQKIPQFNWKKRFTLFKGNNKTLHMPLRLLKTAWKSWMGDSLEFHFSTEHRNTLQTWKQGFSRVFDIAFIHPCCINLTLRLWV